MSGTTEIPYDALVNRLAHEVAQAQRQLGATRQKLTSTTRSLEVRTLELTEARAELSLLVATLDTAQDAILAVGHFGRAMHFNSRFVEMWGISQDRTEGLNEPALLALQMAQVKDPAAFLRLAEAMRSPDGAELCEHVEMGDGRILECRVLPQRVRGRRVGSVARYRDVTGTRPTPA